MKLRRALIIPLWLMVHAGLLAGCGVADESHEPQVAGSVQPDASVEHAPMAASTPEPSGVRSANVAAAPAPEPSAKASATGKKTVYIAPMGPATLSEREVAFVEESLLAFFDIDVAVLEPVPLPESAYYKPRRRYRAEKLLDYLEVRLPEDGDRILGITAKDISTTKGEHPDWGILGLASLDGTVCVLSTFRTHKKSRGKEHAKIRLGKTAVHEIGHTLGLPHCPNRGCLMEDAQGTVLTSDREYDLCEECRAKLQHAGYLRNIDATAPPWPRPSR